jgi:hypothetical protein
MPWREYKRRRFQAAAQEITLVVKREPIRDHHSGLESALIGLFLLVHTWPSTSLDRFRIDLDR